MKVTLLLCLLIVPNFRIDAHETSKGWNEWMSEGSALRRMGNFSEAALSFRQALTIAEGFDVGDRRTLNTLDELASAYSEAGQFAEATYHYRRALLLVDRIEGRNTIDYGLLLGSLASMDQNAVDIRETTRILRRILDQRIGSAQQMNSLRIYLFRIYKDQRQFGRAEGVLLEEQAELERQRTNDPIQKAALLNNLGVIRFNQKRFREARDLYKESVRIRENSVGFERPELIEPLNNLAASLVQLKEFVEADRCFRRAVSLCDKTLGGDHPTCVTTLENYAAGLQKFGSKNDARTVTQAAREARQSIGRRNGVDQVVDLKALRSERRPEGQGR